MAKDADARNELQKLLDAQTAAIEAVEQNISSDEETDAAEMQPLIAQAAANNAKLARLGNVNSDGTDPATPVNPVTGETNPGVGPETNAPSADTPQNP